LTAALPWTAALSPACAAVMLVWQPAHAADTMEAIGAEKCGGPVNSYAVEFLAPENASLAATAKAILNGLSVASANAVALSIDGRPCADGRCPFEAKKGQTYRFAATSGLPKLDELCIVVARP
jgi:hypothetical protein